MTGWHLRAREAWEPKCHFHPSLTKSLTEYYDFNIFEVWTFSQIKQIISKKHKVGKDYILFKNT